MWPGLRPGLIYLSLPGRSPRGPTSNERGAVNVAVTVGGCLVSPGDLIVGDDDGSAALDPRAARTLIAAAEAKLAHEAAWIASLAGGRSMGRCIIRGQYVSRTCSRFNCRKR
jgi:regulator of RNase E activity RraA